MFFWIREIGGWALVAIGIWALWQGFGLLQGTEPKHIEGVIACGTGVMVIRLGVFLIRVSTAARIVTVPKAAVTEEPK